MYINTFSGVMSIIKLCLKSKVFMTLLFLILSPFDLIPESIFGLFGLIDDFFMIIIAFIVLTHLFLGAITRRDA